MEFQADDHWWSGDNIIITRKKTQSQTFCGKLVASLFTLKLHFIYYIDTKITVNYAQVALSKSIQSIVESDSAYMCVVHSKIFR